MTPRERCLEREGFEEKWITVVIDGSEQSILKPNHRQREEICYSGKKAKHTFTKLGACTPKGRILFLSETYEGSRNDSTLYSFPENQIHIHLAKNEYVAADKAWEGWIESRVVSSIKGKKLRSIDQQYNNDLASIRIIIENIFGKIKDFKVCKYELPLKTSDILAAKEQHHKIWVVCAGLVNLYCKPMRE
eukprot:gb/GECH01010475.1/.p1 GENE.gb/GECH01010475.1/~~gb/GECH01010475.1/.p1  ORF type:complete len:190 (+),score=16.42 gb/GECH01010475.1/:1-570(+)